MTTVQIELPEDVWKVLHVTPEQFPLELRLAAALQWFQEGLISQGKAAEIAGMNRTAFLKELGRRKIDVFHVDIDELKKELARG